MPVTHTNFGGEPTSPEAHADAAIRGRMRAGEEQGAAYRRANYAPTPATRRAGQNYRVAAARAGALGNINHRPGEDDA